MKHGFKRLRSMSAVGAIGLGMLGGSARAAATATMVRTVSRGSAAWGEIGNHNNLLPGLSVTPSPYATILVRHITAGGFSAPTSAQSAFAIGDGVLQYPLVSVPLTGTYTTKTYASGFVPTPSGSSTWSSSITVTHVHTYPPGSHINYSQFADAFDQVLILAVGGSLFSNPGGTVDLNADTISSGSVANIIPGLDAQVEYYFDPGHSVVRAVYSLSNTTAVPISTSAVIAGTYTSYVPNQPVKGNITIQASDNGDLVVDDSDRWYITNDAGAVGVDPYYDERSVVTLVRYGAGATVIPVNTLIPSIAPSGFSGDRNFAMRYDLQIPSGSTQRIMVFIELSGDISTASSNATKFETLSGLDNAGLLANIKPWLYEVVNYEHTDSDGDQVIDLFDAFPGDANESIDSDLDGIGDNADNCPNTVNADQSDRDGDGIGDVCDTTPDGPPPTGGGSPSGGGGGSFGSPWFIALLSLLAARIRKRRQS